jgi:hypothetical protein
MLTIIAVIAFAAIGAFGLYWHIVASLRLDEDRS